MFKYRNKFIALFFVLTLVLVGCGKEKGSTTNDDKPSEVRTDLLLFTQERSNDEQVIGSLHIQDFDGEPELIAENVVRGKFTYDNETGHVLFMDDFDILYLYDGGETPTEIAQDVDVIMDTRYLKDGKISYMDEKSNLHIATTDSSTQIGSEIQRFEILGDEVYYNTYDGDFYRFNLESREEFLIERDVFGFEMLSDEGELIYTLDHGGLYFLASADADTVRLSSEDSSLYNVRKDGNSLYFLEKSNRSDSGMDLYRVDLKDNYQSEMLVNNVEYYEISGKSIYYTSPDNRLYKMEDIDANPQRLAIDALGFTVKKDSILLFDEDLSYYRFDEEDNSQTLLGRDVYIPHITDSGDMFYMNYNDELFYGNIKLASSIRDVGFFHGNAVYVDKNALYVKEEAEDAVEIPIEIDEYTTIHYQNQLVFENLLEYKDIVGPYGFLLGNEQSYLEFTADERLLLYETDTEFDFEPGYNTINTLELATDFGGKIDIELKGDGLLVKFDGMEFTAFPENQTVIDEYKGKLEERKAEEKRAEEEETKKRELEKLEDKAASVVEEFVTYLPQAVNRGSYFYISGYIDSSSDFYETQSAFVENAYDSGIKEDLVDLQILETTINEDGTAQVRTSETFAIQSGGDKTTAEYEAIYNLKEIDGRYLITNLNVP